MSDILQSAVRSAVATVIFAGLMALSDAELPVLSYLIYFAVLWGFFCPVFLLGEKQETDFKVGRNNAVADADSP